MTINPVNPLDSLSDPSLFISDAFIEGKWFKTASRFDVHDPATGKKFSSVANVDRDNIKAAIKHASDSQIAYAWGTTASERGAILQKWYELTIANLRDLAIILCLENGKTYSQAETEIKYGASFISWFAAEAVRAYGDTIPSSHPHTTCFTIKQPIGVCGIITPWNWPHAMIARKLAPAFAAGCSVVVKPPSQTPHSALAMTELALRAGIPAGCIQVVPTRDREAASELASNPLIRKLSFTGSTPVGMNLAKIAAGTVKKLSLELGGNAPFIVFDDADINLAVSEVMENKFFGSGQVCVAANRILVQRSVLDEFTTKLTEKVKALKPGSGFDPSTTLGPLITKAAVGKVSAIVEDAVSKGATIPVGGTATPGDGFFYEPTVVTGATRDMRIATEEIFGPVAPVFPFDTEDEAVEFANATDFGLAGYFFSRNISRVLRVSQRMECGMVAVNSGQSNAVEEPFGGIKQSGYGKEGSRLGLDEYQVLKAIRIVYGEK